MNEQEDDRPYEQCPWCDGTNTEWMQNEEPDPHCDFPEQDGGLVYVNLSRYCKDCEECYTVRMRFNVDAGRRMRW